MIITITGPRSVGKSTIGKMLARKMKLRYVSSDDIGEKSMKKYGGLDKAIKKGIIGKFIKNSAYSLIRKEYEKDNFVFDVSGGAVSSRKYHLASEKVRKIAKRKSTIIGLLPYPQTKRSISLLYKREKRRKHFKQMNSSDLLKKTKDDFKKFPPIFKNLCDLIIYTEKKKPEEIVKSVIKHLEEVK